MTGNIFITGANQGLGFSLSKTALSRGWKVFAGVYEMSEAIRKLQTQYGDKLTVVPLRVDDEASVRAAFEAVKAKTDHLDVIINNAGVHFQETSRQPIEKFHWADAISIMNVNAIGPILVLKYFLALVRDSKAKRRFVMNISSEAGSITDCGRKMEYAYCMSKAALNMGGMILSNYLADDGVEVLQVHPGWMRTPMGGSDADHDPDYSSGMVLDLLDKVKPSKKATFVEFDNKPKPW